MPNIGRLTIALGFFEIACGAGVLHRRTAVVSTWAMLCFLVLVTVLGYGLPTSSLGEDLLKNRLSTIVMALLLIPLHLCAVICLRHYCHPRSRTSPM